MPLPKWSKIHASSKIVKYSCLFKTGQKNMPLQDWSKIHYKFRKSQVSIKAAAAATANPKRTIATKQ
jgi:hypothetical protein